MRKKLRELMNKEEGFTLVELLAVIVILGIIVAIAVPAIGNTINNANKDAGEAEEALVEDAARLYFVENPEEPSVSVATLLDDNYLDLRGKTEAEKTAIEKLQDVSNPNPTADSD